ncbi:FUSC family protein [Streptomyces sp. NPDC020917]|uniref:FUSC family protein n=1 Tax=Streptomyces sp. NPDC020917 TaxID=3365102 RepID=UPI00379D705C
MFVAPDPGRARLRFAARALLGISAAVAAIVLAGLPAPAACGGGLAALLAFFTVADPTVRRQAVTTALLPAAGLPVLAVAACLHPHPLLRDAAFVAVVGAGVYARRWGPRGHALGVFAFMMFFVAQFLHAVPADLPELVAALALGLGCAAAVRFGLWCYERGGTPPPAVDLPQPRGLRRPTTRQAVQAATAAAAALALGEAVSADRWYWAVATTWWIFVNTASRGETLVRGFRRVLGTATGIAAGFALAVPLHGATAPSLLLVAVCVFGIFYSAPVSYSWMTFFVTVMAGSLYGLLGVLHPGLLVLRMEETGAGAVAAALAVLLVLPVTTHAATDAWIQRALHTVREAAANLDDAHGAGVAARAAELDVVLGRVRASVAPLVHPLSPLRARRHRARRVLELLDACAHQVRGLAEVAAHPGAGQDERLRAACRRVEHAVLRLVPPTGDRAATELPPGAQLPGRTGPLTATGREPVSGWQPESARRIPNAPRRASETRAAAAPPAAPLAAAGTRAAAAPTAAAGERVAAAPSAVAGARVVAGTRAAAEPRAVTGTRAAAAPTSCPWADRALAHLHGLETALADLAAPLHAAPGRVLATA